MNLYKMDKYIYNIFKNNKLSTIDFNLLCNKFNTSFITNIYNINYNNLTEDFYLYFKLKNLSVNITNSYLYINNQYITNAFIRNIINNNDLNFIYSKFNYHIYYDILEQATIYGSNENINNLINYLTKENIL